MRQAQIQRKTAETDISLSLALEGKGEGQIETGIGFLDHMLTLFAAHSRTNLTVKAAGDLQVDGHHTVEDVGICLGLALKKALGERRGICRYGHVILPMDESLILCAMDISGRGYLAWETDFRARKVGDFDTELAEEFFAAFVRTAGVTLHLRQLAGRNAHHIIEGCFKAFGRALRTAISEDPALMGEVPSTKGVL